MPHRAEANLLALIESTEDLIWSVDLDYRLIIFNRALQQNILNTCGSQLVVGMRLHDLFPPERAALWPPFYERALSNGPFRVEYLLLNGSTLELAFNPIVVDGRQTGVSVFGKDITERKAAEESRSFLAEVVESCEEAVITYAPSGAILTWNRSAEAIYGYTTGEAIGIPFSMCVAPERRENLERVNWLLMSGTPAFHVRGIGLRKDGAKIRIFATTWPIRNSAGEVTAISTIIRDVSLRHEAEKTRALLASIVDSSRDAVHAVDLDGTVVSWNRGAEDLFGYASEEIVGKSIATLAPPGRGQEVPSFMEVVAKGGTVTPFDTSLLGKDGREVEVSLSISPIRNGDGKVMGAAAIARDISQRKLAERALQQAEKKYRDIFEGALEGIFQVSPESVPLSANPAAARMLGFDSPDELLSKIKNAADQVWADPEERAAFVREIEEQGFVLGFECRFKRKDGAILWVSLNTRRVCAAGGQLLCYEGFILDITSRRRIESQLRESLESLKDAQVIGALGSYVLDIAAGAWTSSDVMDEIFGIGEEYERTVAGWTDLIHPEDRARMAAYFEEDVVRGGKPFDKEYRIVRQSDQAERWVHGMGRLEFDAQKRPLKLSGVIHDITERKLSEMQLRNSEERYRATFEQAAVGIVHTALDGRLLRCNTRFAEILGYASNELPGMAFQQLTAPEDLDSSIQSLTQIVSGLSDAASWEKRYIRKDGSLTWAKVTISMLRDSHGRPLHLISLIEDINARKAAEQSLAAAAEALRVSEARYRTAFQTSIDSININRLNDGKYIDCNPVFLLTTGYQREEVLGRTSLELGIWADARDRQTMVEMVRQNSGCRGLEVQFRKKSGELFWGEMSASVVEIDGVACILSVTRDLSSAKEAESTIQSLAFYDPLTGLPNRRMLLERLRRPLTAGDRSGRLQGLLLVDLDHFKTLNDTLGHKAGDLLLKEVARRIAACAHQENTVCRLGGDEFVVMLEDLNEVAWEAAEQAKMAGEGILAAIDKPYMIEERECLLTASIGTIVFDQRKDSTDEVLQQADIALDQAKAEGRNTMRFFSPALQAAVNAHAALEKELRHAIKTNQFLLYYQPQIERGRLTGAEALIRWNHPKRGLVPPDEFIPLAEKSRLILPLGNWVLEKACEQIAAWAGRKETAHLSLSVNISALQFRQPEFVKQVLSALDRTGASPGNLKLELTESMLVENVDEVIARMTELKSHNLSFSLDDFGTGYSSLTYLKRLPLDQLKIDREFVHDMLLDVTSGAIAQTVLSLGRAMGLSVVAEGVETEEQRGYLAGLGCHSFQGYLFSRPLPLEEFEAFLESFAERHVRR